MIVDEDLISISDEAEAERPEIEPWIVICADDDQSAHRSTLFALDGELIEGRPVKLVSAFSAAEAIEVVKNHPEAAALLLDVVMETATAGLDAIAVIRESLHRKALRIIVRSGAPGLMGELETVKKFDITDWRPKNELNQSRLLSAITLAVRAYQEIVRLDKRSEGLDEAMSFLERLAKDPSSEQLMGDLLGSIEASIGQSVWALSIANNGAWRVACGPKSSAMDEGFMCGYGGLSGLSGSDEVLAWLDKVGRHKKILGCATAGQVEISTFIFSEKDFIQESWRNDQTQSLIRALNSALAGQEKSRQEKEACHYDQTTGLLSRQGFIERGGSFAKKIESPCVFLIDLAGFARVNSVLGHDTGDLILKQAGQRIKSLSHHFLCARIASDAFAILMPKENYKASKMEEMFEEPFQTSLIPIPMKPRVSATYAWVKEHPTAWLTRAAAAMDEAKINGISGGEPRWFDPKSEMLALERMALSQKLFLELKDKKSLYMVFQPQINLITRKIVGCEALIRWKDGDKFIPPDKFIPIAEQSGLAMSISEFALSESLAMIRRARLLNLDIPRVSVNLSPVEFESGDLLARVHMHLKNENCLPTDLMIEITETAAAREPDKMVSILSSLRKEGIKIAIDDFGSGYSSLAQLARLPIDELKIDRAFVNALGQKGPFSGIAKMIVDLANSMQMEVVAEGVESIEQANMLIRLGAECGQGYLYAKGLKEDDFFDWLEKVSSGAIKL